MLISLSTPQIFSHVQGRMNCFIKIVLKMKKIKENMKEDKNGKKTLE